MRPLPHLFALLVVISCTTDPYLPDDPCAAGFVDYQNEIQPILTSNCALSGCHDASTAAEEIRLDNYQGVMEEVDAFRPGNSELFEVLSGDMPPYPYPPLTQQQKDLIYRWISEGALNVNCDRCDTLSSLTYTTGIESYVQTHCVGCHGPNLSEAGLRLDTYTYLSQAVQNNNLLFRLSPAAGASRMPPGNPLSDCKIRNIEKWVDAGMPNP